MCNGRTNINGGGRSCLGVNSFRGKKKKYFDGSLWFCSWTFFKVMVRSIVPSNADP